MNLLIGKKLSPDEMVKKWRSSIRTQQRELDKSIRGIETEEAKAKKLLKDAAKRKDNVSCKLLAKEILQSRKAKDRLQTSKAQMNSLIMSMQEQLGKYIYISWPFEHEPTVDSCCINKKEWSK